jgi:prepilin-type N-terminal cleavage/methylation domain-containing protein
MLQKLNKKISRNQKGFSLIELMVAVAILALAALGIFQAFGTGFMSMAESRERTEAVNYVRQALEDIKNMDFDKVDDVIRSSILGTDNYEREVIVVPDDEVNPTQKEVTVVVYWQGRDGELNTSASTLLTKMEFLPGDAEKIVLYVYPFNILYPINDSTELTAVIKDAKGNTVNYWEGDIDFEITVNWEYGYLDEETIIKKTVSAENGLAKCIFNSDAEQLMINNEIAYVTIRASVPNDTDLGFDEVQIMLTPGPVRVLLTAREVSSTDEFTSPVTVETGEELYIVGYILKANNEVFTDYPITINFNIDGEGAISPLTKETDENGKAEILYTAGGNPGTDVITGSVTDLFSGTMEIFIAGEVAAIDIEAYPTTIFDYETSEITVTLNDANGLTVSNPYSENITIDLNILSGSVGSGTFDQAQITITPGQSSGTSDFTPELGSNGEVIIEASDQDAILTLDTTTIIINEPLVPDHIDVNADPAYIKVNSGATSTITATVKSIDNKTVSNYDRVISFTTNKGVFENGLSTITVSSTADNYQDGQTWVTLEEGSGTGSGIATVTVSSNTGTENITGETTVDFYVEADHIELSTSSNDINILGKAGDTCTITATIIDSGGSIVTEYLGSVTFNIVEGSSNAGFANGSSITAEVNNGTATVTLYGQCNPGTVTIEASSSAGSSNIYSNNDLSISVNVGYSLEIILDEGSVNLHSGNKAIDYVITVNGGDLTLYSLEITYNSTARITSILIDDQIVYEGNVGSGDFIQLPVDYTLNGNGLQVYKITYNVSSNINKVSFTTLLNPECENEHYNFAIINF